MLVPELRRLDADEVACVAFGVGADSPLFAALGERKGVTRLSTVMRMRSWWVIALPLLRVIALPARGIPFGFPREVPLCM